MNLLLHLILLLFGANQSASPAVATVPIKPAVVAHEYVAPIPTPVSTASSEVTKPELVNTENDPACAPSDVLMVSDPTVTGGSALIPSCHRFDYDSSTLVSVCQVYFDDGTWKNVLDPNPTGPNCITSYGDGFQGGVMPGAVTG